MTRLYIPLMVALPILFAACKSNDKDLNPTPTNLISGYLIATRKLDTDSPSTKYTEQAQAIFLKHPGDVSIRTIVDSVKLNSTKLILDNSTTLFKATSGIQLQNTTNWQVSSVSNIASFTYNHAAPFPTYNASLPDTIDHSNYVNLPLPMGMDSAVVSLRANQLVQATYKGASASISPAQMATINPGAALLDIAAYKATTQSFGGKNFRFIKETIKVQPIWIK